MSVDLSTAIAVTAALVSSLAAVYARWQAKAAKRANEIALHENRMRVYKALNRLKAQLAAHGTNLTEDEVWNFFEAVEASEFYFPASVHPKLRSIWMSSVSVLAKNEEWREARETDPLNAPKLVQPRREFIKSVQAECEFVATELKPFLRVGEA
jgi:hypothetical protein